MTRGNVAADPLRWRSRTADAYSIVGTHHAHTHPTVCLSHAQFFLFTGSVELARMVANRLIARVLMLTRHRGLPYAHRATDRHYRCNSRAPYSKPERLSHVEANPARTSQMADRVEDGLCGRTLQSPFGFLPTDAGDNRPLSSQAPNPFLPSGASGISP